MEEDRLIQDYMEKKAKHKQRKAEECEKERLCAEKCRDHQLWMEAEQYRLGAENDNRIEEELHWRTEQYRLEHPDWCLVNDSAPSFLGEQTDWPTFWASFLEIVYKN